MLGLTVVMVAIARPGAGESAPFLKSWIIGQVYALGAVVCAVVGVTAIVANWPF